MSAENTIGSARARPQEVTCKSGVVSDADSALEAEIRVAHAKLLSVSWDERTAAWEEFSALIKRRSVNQVRFLERLRGLA